MKILRHLDTGPSSGPFAGADSHLLNQVS